ncbi:hypothetical protein [Phaffia rhodozyma]|uniref:Peptidase A1 domain-containing protein n=1 Tax=Phaffia rhodozyma TaxID=264483 RepID=A0A0F7SM36_PHARH|nr:hypothetical protein [Phaffia rhodozyma]
MLFPAAFTVACLALVNTLVDASPTVTSSSSFIHAPRSEVEAHQKKSSRMIPLPRWLQDPKEASSYLPRDKVVRRAAAQPSVSAVPKTYKGQIYVDFVDKSSTDKSGYLSSYLDTFGQYGTIVDNKTTPLIVDFKYGKNESTNIEIKNGEKDYTDLGLVLAYGLKGADFGPKNPNVLVLAGVSQRTVPITGGSGDTLKSTVGLSTGFNLPAQSKVWVGDNVVFKKCEGDILIPYWIDLAGEAIKGKLYYVEFDDGEKPTIIVTTDVTLLPKDHVKFFEIVLLYVSKPDVCYPKDYFSGLN